MKSRVLRSVEVLQNERGIFLCQSEVAEADNKDIGVETQAVVVVRHDLHLLVGGHNVHIAKKDMKGNAGCYRRSKLLHRNPFALTVRSAMTANAVI